MATTPITGIVANKPTEDIGDHQLDLTHSPATRSVVSEGKDHASQTALRGSRPTNGRECSLFLYIPHEDDRRWYHAFEIIAIGRGDDKLASGDVRNADECLLLNLGGELLLRSKVGSIEPLGAHRLDLFIAWPAKPCLFAIAPQRQIDGGIHHVRTNQPCEKDTPAIFVDRVFDGASVDAACPNP